jgi:hypothetical protein
MPASLDAGDLLLVIIQVGTGASGNEVEITPTPSGWTKLWEHQNGHSSISAGDCGVFVKVADGMEGGSTVGFTTDIASVGAAQVYRVTEWFGSLSGVEAGVSLEAFDTGDYLHPDPPSLSPSWGAANTLWLACGGWTNDDALVSSYPTDYVDGVDTISGGGTDNGSTVFSAFRKLKAANQNPSELTIPDDNWVCNTVAIRPRK